MSIIHVKIRARIKTKARRSSLISFESSNGQLTMGNLRDGTFEIVKTEHQGDDGKDFGTKKIHFVQYKGP